MSVYSSASPRPASLGGSSDVLKHRTVDINSSSVVAVSRVTPSARPANMSRRPQHSRQTSRLPPIAPRDGPALPPPTTAEAASAGEVSSRSSRARLPPRSRSGCWTCRTRKVKCDEGRPRCNQCTRLGHVCDYNPRLAFKDETSKIVEKYLGGGGPSRQWDTSQRLPQEAQASREIDTLPPFSALTTEEDWEKKAGHRAPGTYYVIANSTSFPASGDSTPGASAPRSPMSPSHSRRQSLYGGSTDNASDDGLSRRTANVVLDEDTLILGSVEETSRQAQAAAGGNAALLLQLDQGRTSPGSPIPLTFPSGQGDLGISIPVGLPYPLGRYTQQDLRRRHWRTVVRKHMFSTNGNSDTPRPDQDDIFEQEAEKFPLLGAALDELSAWSLAANGGVQNFDTQERYLEILASLRKHDAEADMKRNGRYLTHTLLLVYEISASHRSWPLHLGALLHIFQIRGKELTVEYPGLVSWIMQVDCNALLCGSGNGKITEFILDNNLLASAEMWMQKKMPVGLSVPKNRIECDMFLKTVKWTGMLFDHCRRLGKLAERYRERMLELGSHSPHVRAAEISRWQQETAGIRLSLEQTWHVFYPDLMNAIQDTSNRDEALAIGCETCWFLYHSLIVYSYTSMWPTQRMEELYAHEEAAVAQYCTAILERCETLLIRGEFSRRAIVFPLFLAGFCSQDLGEKRHALDLLHLMEQASIGNNTRATRRWLERLYGEQAMAQESGMLYAVDWVSKIKEQNFCIVHCGF